MTDKNIKQWDVFISHASQDKQDFVIPLAQALQAKRINVWLDQWAIDIGDSISAKISDGLKQSRFGIVVLSKNFFVRPWTQKELGALFSQEADGVNRIIPIWYKIEHSDVLTHAPLLADRMAARYEDGINTIVERIIRLLSREKNDNQILNEETIRILTKKLFPTLPIDEFWQTQLLADLDVALYRSPDDIELAYKRAQRAVETYAQEQPHLFRSGTDYLTKSLGFVDLCFRERHNWSEKTKRAFQRLANEVEWEIEI